MIHEDPGIPTVQEDMHDSSTKHRIKPQTHSTPCSTPFPEKTSYEDWNDGGQLTCNMANEIPSQEWISSR